MAGGLRSRQGIPKSTGVGKAKARWGRGCGSPFSRSSTPPLMKSVPKVGQLHPVTPGSIIVASIGGGSHVPRTDVASGPEVLPPYDRDISGCHPSSFPCFSEEYQVQVRAGTALAEAAEVGWDTIHPQMGDMLLMVATNRHHGMLAVLGAKDGLKGALFHLWTADAKHRHHQPNTTHLDPPPPPPSRPWPLLGICPVGTAPAWTRCCGRGMLPRRSSPTPLRRSRLPPPSAPTTPPSSPAPLRPPTSP